MPFSFNSEADKTSKLLASTCTFYFNFRWSCYTFGSSTDQTINDGKGQNAEMCSVKSYVKKETNTKG